MSNKWVMWTAWLMGLAALLVSVFSTMNQTKSAYVRSQELVYKYQGMVDAKASFDVKKTSWQSNIDTLKKDFELHVNWFRENQENLSDNDLSKEQQLLEKQQEDLYNYSGQLQQKVKEEEEKLLQGVLNQVNSFAEEFGRAQGYDLIFGTTLSGSILYGDEAIDITDQVLDALNKQYRGRGVDEQ